jgi:hypothetical protein
MVKFSIFKLVGVKALERPGLIFLSTIMYGLNHMNICFISTLFLTILAKLTATSTRLLSEVFESHATH